MNHSFGRLIDGMVNTLRKDIIPHIGTEFARGQAFGVIYMLNSIRLRGNWSVEFFTEQLSMLENLNLALEPMIDAFDSPPLPNIEVEEAATSADLQAVFEAAQQRVCGLLDWLYCEQKNLDPVVFAAVDTALKKYMSDQVRFEIATSAKPMFAEISSGAE